MKNNTELSKFLKKLRVDRGETVDEMATKIGITGAYLCNMEAKGILPATIVKMLASQYKISPCEKDTLVSMISKEVLNRFWSKK